MIEIDAIELLGFAQLLLLFSICSHASKHKRKPLERIGGKKEPSAGMLLLMVPLASKPDFPIYLI